MESSRSSISSVFVYGILVFIPIAFLIFLADHILEIIKIVFDPILRLLPKETIIGIEMPTITAFFLLAIIILITGYVAKSGFGSRIIDKVDAVVPGFYLIKNLLLGKVNIADDRISTCLALIDEAWLFGFIIEQHDSGMLTVYVPDAPSFLGGSLYIMREEQIKRLKMKNKDVIKSLMQFGFGAKDFIDKEVKW
jgi:uncharacterized membrane protein